jgi:uncharacterized protein (DUF433 family)/DNA-binding transcriptional MerR regulator
MGNSERGSGHYTTHEIARLAGVRPRRIGQWRRLGLLPRTGRVPGTYSYADAAEAVLAHYLVESKLRPREVAQIVRNLRDKYGDWPLSTAPLEHDGKLVVVREGEELVLDVGEHADQGVLEATLDLREVRDALAHGGWVALDKRRESVEVDPDKLAGAPTVRGHRIPTELVADLLEEARGRKTLREEYGLTDREIDEAADYEADVRKAIA